MVIAKLLQLSPAIGDIKHGRLSLLIGVSCDDA